jgi:hypothetical protein
MSFPTHFPENCPPDTAKPANGEVFRYIDKEIPQECDFQSYFVLGKPFRQEHKCEACGCSVYVSEKAARARAAKAPFLRRKKLAKGRLSPEWGVMAETWGTGHHTWWVPEGKNPTKLFDLVQ